MFALPISKHVLKALFFNQNSPKIKLFCKKLQNFRALGALPPDPRVSGGWRLCQKKNSLRWLRASPPDPQNSSPLQISGYAPGHLPYVKEFKFVGPTK